MLRRWWNRFWEWLEPAEEENLPSLAAFWLPAARSAGSCCGCESGGCALPIARESEEGAGSAPSR